MRAVSKLVRVSVLCFTLYTIPRNPESCVRVVSTNFRFAVAYQGIPWIPIHQLLVTTFNIREPILTCDLIVRINRILVHGLELGHSQKIQVPHLPRLLKLADLEAWMHTTSGTGDSIVVARAWGLTLLHQLPIERL